MTSSMLASWQQRVQAEWSGGFAVRSTAKAFGFNYFIFPPNQEGREHDHGDSNLEEV